MENKSTEQRMETEPVHRVILSLAVPTVLSMLVISAYSIVDTFFVTRLGSRATGAVGITFALVAWIQAVGYTVGMGAGSLVSRLLERKKRAGRADCKFGNYVRAAAWTYKSGGRSDFF